MNGSLLYEPDNALQVTANQYSVGPALACDLDIFGRLRRRVRLCCHRGADRGDAAVPPCDALTLTGQTCQIAVQQATLLSYLDAFKAIAVIFLFLLPLLFLVKPGAATENAHAGE